MPKITEYDKTENVLQSDLMLIESSNTAKLITVEMLLKFIKEKLYNA